MLAIDAGQSMQCGGVLGCRLITPLIASAAMAMLFVRSEPNYQVVAMSNAVEPLDVRCTSSLTDICTAVSEVCVSLIHLQWISVYGKSVVSGQLMYSRKLTVLS